MEALREELQTMKNGALQKRARDLGVADEVLDEASDADDPREALVALVLAASSATAAAATQPAEPESCEGGVAAAQPEPGENAALAAPPPHENGEGGDQTRAAALHPLAQPAVPAVVFPQSQLPVASR
eukprot:COSAG03_NODE_7507_length_908_cov_0.954265_1_plen_127_part_10